MYARWLVLALVAFGVSVALTGVLRGYAVRRKLLDVPNARSSHDVPTPRGGGVAIVTTALLGLVALGLSGVVTAKVVYALGGAGLLVAAVGWLDDHGHVAARWRLLTHFAAALWGTGWLGGLPDLPVLGVMMPGEWLWVPLLLYVVWLLNLYNFMDGIDGIAGVEAVTVCLGGVLLAAWGMPEVSLALPLLLAAASAGFLVWNFPPARIFMGDAGSGFVGLWLGLLSVFAATQAAVLFWGWVILLGVFVTDATVTLVRRCLRGEKVYEAHRSHAYQRLARRFGHRPVTLLCGAVNVLWLFPVAAWVVVGGLEPVSGVLLAYAPLVVAVCWLGAGSRERR
ncbi:MraY family glycosyltransferase [Marinimicrobium sp. ARAG 43.8]|uniref:MraY family glycosyltransferase n=1 Tax=Marinimicrobium sp. ARAG 43.8 TaxID=3418719 RepID=UPI003CF00A3B